MYATHAAGSVEAAACEQQLLAAAMLTVVHAELLR
jgi:hypothetical protein